MLVHRGVACVARPFPWLLKPLGYLIGLVLWGYVLPASLGTLVLIGFRWYTGVAILAEG